MRSTSVLVVGFAIVLLCSPAMAAITINYDAIDADYIFGRRTDSLQGKYVAAKQTFVDAKEYVETALGSVSTSSSLSTFDYTVSPRSGRTITPRSISGSETFVYFDAYYNTDDSTYTESAPISMAPSGRTNGCRISINLNGLDMTSYNYRMTLYTRFIHDFYNCLLFNEKTVARFVRNSQRTISVSGQTFPNVYFRDEMVSSKSFDGTNRNFWTLDQGTYNAAAVAPTPVIGQSIVTWLKVYSGVDMTGVLMENSGSETSYRFENAIYYADIATALKSGSKLLTQLAPQFAWASGFYGTPGTNVYQFNTFVAAKSTTTSTVAAVDSTFQTKQSLTSTAQGYCTSENEMTCSQDGLYKLKCVKDEIDGAYMYRTITDHCYIARTVAQGADSNETWGPQSRCFMASVSSGTAKPMCFQVKDSGSVLTGITDIKIADGTSTSSACTAEGSTFSLPVKTTVTVTCPGTGFVAMFNAAGRTEVPAVATALIALPKDCSGNGIYLWSGSITPSGSCRCFYGYSGADCGTKDELKLSPIFTDPYNPYGLGFKRMNFGSLAPVAYIWTAFTLFWLAN